MKLKLLIILFFTAFSFSCRAMEEATKVEYVEDKATNLEQLTTMAQLQQKRPEGYFPIHYAPETEFVLMSFLNPQEGNVIRYTIYKDGSCDEEESDALTEIEQMGLSMWKELHPNGS